MYSVFLGWNLDPLQPYDSSQVNGLRDWDSETTLSFAYFTSYVLVTHSWTFLSGPVLEMTIALPTLLAPDVKGSI